MSDNQKQIAVIPRPENAFPIQTMADLKTASELIQQAGFLGARNAGEGMVILKAAQQAGMGLIEFQQKFHFRQGRFSMQAHAMLSELVDRGGSYKINQRDDKCASLTLTKGDNTYTSTITWEDALGEPFVYAGNEDAQLAELDKPLEKRKLKAKYKTPRSRMQMLWARAVSDGVVVVDPGARMLYTPEEVDDITVDSPRAPRQIATEEAVRRARAVEPVVVDAGAGVIPIVYTICPDGFGEYSNKPWREFTDEELEAAHGASAMPQPYKDGIVAEFKRRHPDAAVVADEGGEQ
jgi:hypothetical protein